MFKHPLNTATVTTILLLSSLLLTACGGSSGGGNGGPVNAADVTLSFAAVKTFRFDWNDTDGATFYRVLENPDGISGFNPVSEDIPQGTQNYELTVPLYKRINAQYILQSCNSSGCTDSANVSVSGNLATAVGYFKASNTDADDEFGTSVSLSADGNTLAVGANRESSNATGTGGGAVAQGNNSAIDAGAVYIFIHAADGSWQQQAYIKASNTDAGDEFGTSVSLSADGNTLAVGANKEGSNATGVNDDITAQNNNSAGNSGAVYIFIRSATGDWEQQTYIKASNTDVNDNFGTFVSLNADGNTLAVGAKNESSNATGVNGDTIAQNNNSVSNSGAVYVFTRSTSGGWGQQTYIKASNTGEFDRFGNVVSLSADGNTLAVGAIGERSNTTGTGGGAVAQGNNDAMNAGAVYVFTRSASGGWEQQAYIKASNTNAEDHFAVSVSLSDDGNNLAVGANREDSNATGVNGNDGNNNTEDSGAVYIFTRAVNGSWGQQAYIKPSNTDLFNPLGVNVRFGSAVSLSANGNNLAVGATGESSSATGVNGNQSPDSAFGTDVAGAVYVFTRTANDSWGQQAYIKASNTNVNNSFGNSISLSADGNALAVGAFEEDSNAKDVGGDQDQSNNTAINAGSVYVY